MADVMRNLRDLANEGATVVAVHHKSKTQGSHYRGSSDIAGGVDTAFSVSRDRQAGILRLECFRSVYRGISITLRPDLAEMGDFVVTEAPEVAADRDDAEILAQAIRSNPGRTQSDIVTASGLAKAKAMAILRRHDGQLWQSKNGAHNAKQFFPIEIPATVEIKV